MSNLSGTVHPAPPSHGDHQPAAFRIARSIAAGVGLTGILTVALSVAIPMTRGLVSRTEMLGGTFLMFSGILLVVAYRMLRPRTVASGLPGYGLAAVFLAAGAGFVGKGYSAEQLEKRRFIRMKNNLKTIGEALERTRNHSPEEKTAAETRSR